MFATPGTLRPHPVNDPARTWPESNCYLDLWIGLLHAAGQDPLPLLGCAAGLAWEGDHFTFLKPNAADLFELCGVVLQELALWHRLEDQAAAQLARGAVPMPEVDAVFLPDSGRQPGKTTIAITAIDPAARAMHYVHNGGLHHLAGDDYAGVLGLPPHETRLPPYTELARLPEDPPPPRRDAARAVLARLAATRGPGNPVRAFAAALPELMQGRADQVHLLCFNTARQLGAGFGLLADHLAWLGDDPAPAARLAEQAKTMQFQLARATRRGRIDPPLAAALDQLAETWTQVVGSLPLSPTPPGASAAPPPA